MSYREVTMIEVKEVLRLWMKGQAKKRIAAQLGLDPRTVRRYLRAARRCGVEAGGAQEPNEEQVGAVMVLLRGVPARPYGAAWELCVEQRRFIEQHLRSGVRLSKVFKKRATLCFIGFSPAPPEDRILGGKWDVSQLLKYPVVQRPARKEPGRSSGIRTQGRLGYHISMKRGVRLGPT